MSGSGKPPVRVEIPDGQGAQVGDGNVQVNIFGRENLSQQDATGAGGDRTVVAGDVPQEPAAFQWRDGLMQELRLSGSTVAVVRAVTGMRGVGKTQVAAAYARWCIDAGWRLVAWVNAVDEAGVLGGLATVAARLGIGEPGAPLEGIAKLVRHHLEADGAGCLVVFDNVTDPGGLRPFLPAAGLAQVLVTTTSQAQAPNLGRVVPVGVFTEAEALAFLASRTGRLGDDGALAVARELGFLPLALAQAGAVIAAQHLSYGAYLERLQSLPVGEYLIPARGEPYPHGVAEAVLLSLDAVTAADRAGLCQAMLDVVSLLPASGVPRRLLYAAGEAGVYAAVRARQKATGAQVVDEALELLAEGSLLAFSSDDCSVIAHRLVMRVARERRVRDGTLADLGLRICGLLAAVRPSVDEPWRNRETARELIGQVAALQQHLAPLLDRDHTTLDRSLLDLRIWSLRCLNDLGENPVQAMEYGDSLVVDCERLLGSDHPDTLTSRNNLALAYQAAGRAAEAIPLLERTLADRDRLLGANHPDTLTSRDNLASAYRAAGLAIKAAIPIHVKTISDRERVLGIDHPDTLTSRNNLALAYQADRRVFDAIKLLKRTLADRERVLGIDHPDTLTSRNNLALAYQSDWRAAEAIPLFERTLADRERVLGIDHPDTLAYRNNLARAYQADGRAAQAIAMHEQTLADFERLLGSNHLDTLTSRNNLALAYKADGRAAEAIQLLERTLGDFERLLGADHPKTATVLANLTAVVEMRDRNNRNSRRRRWLRR